MKLPRVRIHHARSCVPAEKRNSHGTCEEQTPLGAIEPRRDDALRTAFGGEREPSAVRERTGSSGPVPASPSTVRFPRYGPKTESSVVALPLTYARVAIRRPDESSSHFHQTMSRPCASNQAI